METHRQDPSGAVQSPSRSRKDKLKATLYQILEAGHSYDWQSRVFEASMAVLIVLNVVAFTLETVPEIQVRYGHALSLFNFVSIGIFTLEYAARLWVCTEHKPLQGLSPTMARLKFARNPLMVIDLIAILPFYLSFIAPIDLRLVRIFRLLRFFKLARFSPAFNTMVRAVARERQALFGVLIVLVGMIISAASLLYLAEGHLPDSPFATVPEAMWWAIATLTTVGYGDVTPVTPLGKILAGLVMISGLGFFALPIGIIASGFMEEFRRRDFIVTWGMVARSEVFADLSSKDIAELLTVLKARTAPPGAVIVFDGERPGALFVVGVGTVDLVDDNDPDASAHRLDEGECWGASSLISGAQSKTARAVTTCDLIVLDQHDFRELAQKRPSTHQRVLSKLREYQAADKPPGQ